MKYVGQLKKKKGMLLKSMADGTLFFREYIGGGEFIDYKIAHTDITITIDDIDAHVYELNGEMIIDHSPETLGISSK